MIAVDTDPAAGKQNRLEAYRKLVDTGNETIYSIVQAEGLNGTGNMTQQVQQPMQQQQVVYVAAQQQGYPPQGQPQQYGQAPPQYAQAPPQYAQQGQPQYPRV